MRFKQQQHSMQTDLRFNRIDTLRIQEKSMCKRDCVYYTRINKLTLL